MICYANSYGFHTHVQLFIITSITSHGQVVTSSPQIIEVKQRRAWLALKTWMGDADPVKLPAMC